jgi:hypothetical protein
LQIKEKKEIMIKKQSDGWHGFRLSMDWIHNLVYYNADKMIIVFNMTQTIYEFIVIEEVDYITDLSVNPLNSTIFNGTWSMGQNKGKILKSSQDGSERTILTDKNIKYPKVLTIDLVLKKVIWIDRDLNTFSSIDFDGKNFSTFGTFKSGLHNFFMDIFDDYIYWTEYYENSLFKTKFGVNETQMDYLITSETNRFGPLKIIDPSLQPNSTNRCINHNCSYLCIPININQYRCVCPQFRNRNDKKTCTQSVSIQTKNSFSDKCFIKCFHK